MRHEVITRPKRIQRTALRNWRLPANSVYVGRPSIFGNPFSASGHGYETALHLYRRWIIEGGCVHGYPYFTDFYDRLVVALPEIRGKDLACWCTLDQECHADVLLALVNKATFPKL